MGIADADAIISEEQAKKQRWTSENVRRRHDYFPMLFKLIDLASSKGMLEDMDKEAQVKDE